MAVDSRILVAHPAEGEITTALQGLLGDHPLHWQVTIRPSARTDHWSIEIRRPGLFVTCAARPSQQTAAAIRELVKGVLCAVPVAVG